MMNKTEQDEREKQADKDLTLDILDQIKIQAVTYIPEEVLW
jgi:hypothetical protein